MQENIMNFVWEKSNLRVRFLCACDRWKDIGTIAHNKSAITVEITSRDDTIIFHMVSVVSACAHTHTHTSHKVFQWEVKHAFSDILARRQARGRILVLHLLWIQVCTFQNINVFLRVFASAGGYGNGKVHRPSFHGQTQILQTEQDLCRVSLEDSWRPLKHFYTSSFICHLTV